MTERLRFTKGYVLITLSLQKEKKVSEFVKPLLYMEEIKKAKRFTHKFTISTFPIPQPVTDNEPWLTKSKIFFTIPHFLFKDLTLQQI